MSNTLIKNIQIGDLIYQLSGSSNTTSGVARVEADINFFGETGYQIIRPNSIVSLNAAYNPNICMVGIPQEYAQESGKLVLFCENFGILQDIPEKDAAYTLVNKKLTILVDLDTAQNPSYDGICYPSSDTKRNFKLTFLWHTSNPYLFMWGSLTLDGRSYEDYRYGDNDLLPSILSDVYEYDNIAIVTNGEELSIYNLNTDNASFFEIYNGYNELINGGSISDLVYSFSYNELEHLVLYTGPSYMEVNPVSHYMFNIVMPSENTLITNIPLTWSQDIAPEFGEDKLVQISVLDGVGTFNSIALLS